MEVLDASSQWDSYLFKLYYTSYRRMILDVEIYIENFVRIVRTCTSKVQGFFEHSRSPSFTFTIKYIKINYYFIQIKKIIYNENIHPLEFA